jgi:hypothetical protein
MIEIDGQPVPLFWLECTLTRASHDLTGEDAECRAQLDQTHHAETASPQFVSGKRLQRELAADPALQLLPCPAAAETRRAQLISQR